MTVGTRVCDASHQRANRRPIGGRGVISAPRMGTGTGIGFRRVLGAALIFAAGSFAAAPVAHAQTAGAPVLPIPSDPGSSAPPFVGATATPNPIGGIRQPPRHPFMAPNGRSNIHDDAYQTDTYEVSGPLGDGNEVSTLFVRECASVMFDSQGRIVTICVGLDRPVLALLDPANLRVLAALPLPPRSIQSSSGNPFSDFSGGGYFYLDQRDRAVFNTTERHLLEVAITAGPGFSITRDYDLSGAVPADDGIISVLPDWSGRFWFVTRKGLVGTVDRGSGRVRRMRLEGEGISNSFAVDETGGVFIVSDAALYRFDAGSDGEPVVTWRQGYPDVGVRKPGQSDAGSGTTPTLMGTRWVTITDNDDPMNIRVYRRSPRLKPTKAERRRKLAKASPRKRLKLRLRWRTRTREICSEPVFARGAGSTDQSLIAAGNSIIAENNYGYSGPTSVESGGTTSPGLTRVDVSAKRKKKGGKGKGKGKKSDASVAKRKGKRKVKRYACRTVWTSNERAPSVVPKLSLGNGLVYTYTKPEFGSEDPWYFTALDFRTGQTVFKRFAGDGLGYNNNFAPVTLGPDGTAYVGVLGGLVALR